MEGWGVSIWRKGKVESGVREFKAELGILLKLD